MHGTCWHCAKALAQCGPPTASRAAPKGSYGRGGHMENKRNGHARVAAAPLLPRRRRHCRNRCAAPSLGLHSPANACSPLWSHQHIPHPWFGGGACWGIRGIASCPSRLAPVLGASSGCWHDAHILTSSHMGSSICVVELESCMPEPFVHFMCSHCSRETCASSLLQRV